MSAGEPDCRHSMRVGELALHVHRHQAGEFARAVKRLIELLGSMVCRHSTDTSVAT